VKSHYSPPTSSDRGFDSRPDGQSRSDFGCSCPPCKHQIWTSYMLPIKSYYLKLTYGTQTAGLVLIHPPVTNFVYLVPVEIYQLCISMLSYCSLINIHERAFSFSIVNALWRTSGVCRSQPLVVRVVWCCRCPAAVKVVRRRLRHIQTREQGNCNSLREEIQCCLVPPTCIVRNP
jgi:hypothetical protein